MTEKLELMASEDAFAAWKETKVSKAFFEAIAQRINQSAGGIAMGGTVFDDAEKTLRFTAGETGFIAGLNWVLSLGPKEVTK